MDSVAIQCKLIIIVPNLCEIFLKCCIIFTCGAHEHYMHIANHDILNQDTDINSTSVAADTMPLDQLFIMLYMCKIFLKPCTYTIIGVLSEGQGVHVYL